jgi:hypothetical protein
MGENTYFVLVLQCSMEMPTLKLHSSLLLNTPAALFIENKQNILIFEIGNLENVQNIPICIQQDAMLRS